MAALDVTELRRALKQRWPRTAIGALIGFAVMSAYAFLAPEWYESQLVVVPGATNKPTNALLGMLSGDSPLELGGGSDAERIQSVMKSRSVADAVIEHFGLVERYHLKHPEDARKALVRRCSTRLDKKANTITVTCEDRDAKIAQAMTAYFGVVGNQIMRHISASSAGEERRFLEERVAQSRKEVNDAAQRVREFEEKHKIIDLPEQSKAVVSALSTIKGDLLSKQLQLDYLNGFSSNDESTSVQLRRQVGVLQSTLRSLEDLPADGDHDAAEDDASKKSAARKSKRTQDIFPVAMSVPRIRFELGELYREQKIQEAVFLLLTQRYELARVNEARDTSVFQVLDEPVVATRPSSPKRAQWMIVGALLGLLAGAALSVREVTRRSS